MQIALTALGNVSETGPKKFWRVECYKIGRRIADFTSQAEAEKFAIFHAKENGYRFDHKVAAIQMVGA